MASKVLIIAEAGVNHNGSLEKAKALIDVAANAGADVVKFQTFRSESLVTAEAPMAQYQAQNTGKQTSQLEMLKNLELSIEQHHELIQHCKTRNIEFLSTGFDMESLLFLKSLHLSRWKVPSGEITNWPYLDFIGKQKSQVILSTGMADMQEIQTALQVLISAGTAKENICVLQCTTEYPAPPASLNLKAIETIKKEFQVSVGFSDHSLGPEAAIAAVALGATIIEKHITLDQNLPGPDHKASMEPQDFTRLVQQIRNIELALGDGQKKPHASEMKNRAVARKSIVAKTRIRQGDVFSFDNLSTKRPGTGLSPMKIQNLIGQVSSRDYQVDEMIQERLRD